MTEHAAMHMFTTHHMTIQHGIIMHASHAPKIEHRVPFASKHFKFPAYKLESIYFKPSKQTSTIKPTLNVVRSTKKVCE
eukprot:scaffold642030_cov34-Prasinocladus_malaysianus.AAC.1